MISDLDIWRAANLLIRQHGTDAELEAAKRADLMLERGDLDGQSLWRRIRRAIIECRCRRSAHYTEPRAGGSRRQRDQPSDRLAPQSGGRTLSSTGAADARDGLRYDPVHGTAMSEPSPSK